MNDAPKFYTPHQSEKATQKKKTKQATSKATKKEKKINLTQEQSTRSIRFVKRGVQDVVTYFFWGILFLMTFFVTVSYARYGVVLRKINQKEINPEEIVADINKSNESENRAMYKSRLFLEQLFTYDPDNKEERSDYLNKQLANGLTENMLVSFSTKTTQHVTSIVFVEDELLSKRKEHYSFTFDVSVEANSEEQNFQISLPVSIKNNDFKVINYPTYVNVEPSDNVEKNNSYYQEKDYLTKGSKIDNEQKKALDSFTQDFFKLYASNDASLKLISNVTGLKGAELKNVNIKNMVKKDDFYVVEGLYSVSYDTTSEVTSFFSLDINKTDDTFFVVNLK